MPSTHPAVQADIVAHDIHKSFGVTKALDGCSFSARFGEIHAIVGGNGCGKSTLAKVLSGVLPIDSGHVSVMGHTPTTPRDARMIGVATVFQEVLVADECTVVDNLFVGADSLWSKAYSNAEKYDSALEMMRELTGIEIDPEAHVGSLPLSVKQWITIGRALLRKPKVLVLDESSAALDFDSTERLFAKMRELRDAGAAVLIVTHRIAELIRISDRATVMRDGRDVGVLGTDEITEKNLLGLMTGQSGQTTSESASRYSVGIGENIMETRRLKVWGDGPEIDFSLERGEIVGVSGLDGQGQNEFVRVLAGVQMAVQGETVVRNGSDYRPLANLREADELRVAYVSGDRKKEGIFANLSIYENLLLPLYGKIPKVPGIKIIDWPSLTSVFDSMVEKLSIKHGFPSDKITSLSGGNQQKVLIGRALALRPRILVLNDPARGIDVEAKRELYEHLRDFAKQGNAVVFLSSELEEFVGLCSRVLVFRHGGVFDSFDSKDIDPDRILEAMFGHSAASAVTSGPLQNTGALGQVAGGRLSSVVTKSPRKEARAASEVKKPETIRIVDFENDKQALLAKAKQAKEKKIKIVYSEA